MRELYEKKSANYPRLKTDKLFDDHKNQVSFTGFVHKNIKYIEDFQLLDSVLWKRFVEQFREEDADFEGGWRGEYWGKMMRGACFTYSYTKNPELYNVLCETVKDIMSTMDEEGRISSYEKSHEFQNWDMWSRKYVLLGMQYFIEICDDEDFAKEVIACMCKQADYIISKIGPYNEGKMLVTRTSDFWKGLNSSSILEPVVRLYNITEEKKYLDFATHIVECGGTLIENVFELAYQDKLYPYQYPVTKAYEMISCFDGLLEYYRVTGTEKYKTAVINFATKVLEADFTIIGSCGCTHELFDHSTVRQANTTNGVQQETCVTVTLMKFLYQLTLITGDSKYVDAFETSLYNGYFGSINTEKQIEDIITKDHPDWIAEPLPFNSYSPLTADTRSHIIGGMKVMSDNHYYGCCACIGSAGNGLISKLSIMTSEKGFAYNLFIDGTTKSHTPKGNEIEFITETTYPVSGNVKFALKLDAEEEFEILIRNPEWSEDTVVLVNGEKAMATKGYIALNRVWKDGDVIEISLDMRTKAIRPIPYGSQVIMNKSAGCAFTLPQYDEEDPMAKHHIALKRGPIILAQENRLGYSVDTPVDIKVNDDGCVDVVFPEKDVAPYEHIIEVRVLLTNGEYIHLTDYSSAGKIWTEEGKMAAWILTV